MIAVRRERRRARDYVAHVLAVALAGTLLAGLLLNCARERPANTTASLVHASSQRAAARPAAQARDISTPAGKARTPHYLKLERPSALVYPARSGSRSLVVMLHGMCSRPSRDCSAVAHALDGGAWLVCPRGTITCRDGDATWEADPTRTIRRAVRSAQAQVPGMPETFEQRTLVGFSLGAMRAAKVAASGEWQELVLIGAFLPPALQQSCTRAVRRAVFAAGEKDAAARHMRWMAGRLSRAGIQSQFVSLGPFGHELPEVAGAPLRSALLGPGNDG